MVKKVFFDNIEILHMFMVSLSNEYKFHKEESGVYTSTDLSVSFIYDFATLGFKKEFQYNENEYYVIDRNEIYAGNKEDGRFKRNKLIELLDKSGKVLIVDIDGETLFVQNDSISLYHFIELINNSKNCYMLTHRDFNEKSNKVFTNNILLSLFGFFYKLQDRLHIHPPIPELESKNKKYDFISYLGLKNTRDWKTWRHDIIDKINFSDKTLFLPDTFGKDTSYIINEILDDVVNPGSLNWYSLLESEQAKIKIIFETVGVDSNGEPNDFHGNSAGIFNNFLTEKTLKCFLHTQPYFIFMHNKNRKLLTDLGFLFPDDTDTIESQVKYINELCSSNIDEWIDKHKHMFIHNKKLFYKLLYSAETSHINHFVRFLNI